MSAVFPIAYFGSISYYRDLMDYSLVTFEVYENFVKQSCRNRVKIVSANGVMELSIPVIKPNGSKTLTKDILISNTKDWRKDHWRAIESAYRHSAYFDYYGEEVKKIIYQKNEKLLDFDLEIMNTLKNWLDLPYSFTLSSSFTPINSIENDYRFGYTKYPFKHDYSYFQVFQDKMKFVGDLSVLDAIFNLGPMARKLLIN
jgi:hypothetical protein